MDINETLLNEIVLLRQTLERIATSLEDIDDTLEIMFLEEDCEDEDMEDLELWPLITGKRSCANDFQAQVVAMLREVRVK